MRRALTVVALITSALLFTGCSSTASLRPTGEFRVLFVGNSLTYYNDVPAMFASIHRKAHPRQNLQTALLAAPGGSLRERLNDGGLERVLQQGGFDIVVLQDGGGWPLCADQDHRCPDSESALQAAATLVRHQDARPIWYATWQRLPAAQKALSSRVETVSRHLDIEVADSGATMFAVDDPTVHGRLLLPDGHPTDLGSWLVASALYAAVEQALPPDEGPDRSCGVDWQVHKLDAQTLASRQGNPQLACHQIAASDWQSIRKAVAAAPGFDSPPR